MYKQASEQGSYRLSKQYHEDLFDGSYEGINSHRRYKKYLDRTHCVTALFGNGTQQDLPIISGIVPRLRVELVRLLTSRFPSPENGGQLTSSSFHCEL